MNEEKEERKEETNDINNNLINDENLINVPKINDEIREKYESKLVNLIGKYSLDKVLLMLFHEEKNMKNDLEKKLSTIIKEIGTLFLTINPATKKKLCFLKIIRELTIFNKNINFINDLKVFSYSKIIFKEFNMNTMIYII